MFLDELTVRREVLKEQQRQHDGDERLESLHVRVFDVDGENLSAMALAAARALEEEGEEGTGGEDGEDGGDGGDGEDGQVGGGENDDHDEDDDDEDRTIHESTVQRARLMQLRAASAEKERRKGFRSKDAVKLEKLQSKDKRHKRASLKIGKRGGVSIAARFSLLETPKDVLRHLVRDVLSTEAAIAIQKGALNLVLTCRDPKSSRGRCEFARSSEMVWPDIKSGGDGCGVVDYATEDCGRSLLELKMVPSGRVWVDVAHSRGSSGGDFKGLLRPELSQLFDQAADSNDGCE